ncbi:MULTISPECIES: RNA-binding S4 domain-containing protein [unclassified Bacteroides]|jgi:ribosome-associated heat shock protein Hsp15|uniref:RNA-binding S4 domain-containing protein n=1 Tax=unclassified Bacteroides TaxID=2646097 RepID=UPI000E97298A|nr:MULTISPECIES: RNA-binding S4 domain-containing protein [unclassified Bacteroides]RGN43374.1 RNA-binding S4 domain-containing protein [Bacteroides sp. OM05-12]RHR73792.1 RNA-binding S4 domain-containing protein [Bacteroides sp. AF16-49]
MAEARIDKWLWATRIFKTRTIAAEACKKGRVMIGGSQVKAARMIKPGDVIQVKKPPITYSFKVVQPIEKRVGAKLVSEYMENVTTPDQYELLEMSKISGFVDRARGTGRPTKKERRSLEDFTEPEFMDDFDFDFDFDNED